MRLPLTLAFVLAAVMAKAALSSPDWLWVRNISTPFDPIVVYGYSPGGRMPFLVDGVGNVYLASYCNAEFLKLSDSILVSNGQYYLAKFKPDGECVWAQTASSPLGGISFDPMTNICFTGSFSASASFGQGTNAVTLQNSSSDLVSLYIGKISAEGAVLFVRSVAAVKWPLVQGLRTACSRTGDVYFAMTTTGQLWFGTNRITGTGVVNLYLARLTSAGDLISATNAGNGVDVLNGFKIAEDGSLLLCGSFGWGRGWAGEAHSAVLQ